MGSRAGRYAPLQVRIVIAEGVLARPTAPQLEHRGPRAMMAVDATGHNPLEREIDACPT
jgi:hypothetical protein